MLRNSNAEIAIAGRIAGRQLTPNSTNSKSSECDDINWADRSEYWLQKIAPKSRQFKKRGGFTEPLILTGHGVSLRIDRGSLLVRNGFTHYPQDREEWRFFSGDWRLPTRIVLLDVDGGISFDALAWLANRQIPLVQINWRGEVINIIGGNNTAVNSQLAERQIKARANGRRVRIAQELILQKIGNSLSTLRTVFPSSLAVKSAAQELKLEFSDLKRRVPPSVSHLMGIEGRVGYFYFTAWRSHPLIWSNIRRHPIPEEWRYIGPRSSKASKPSNPNRYATHPFNAMLNYAYGVLETQVRRQIVASGLDPTIGYLHGNYRSAHALVYDLMEPLRPIVDRKVLEFVQRETFEPGDFVLLNDGICRLNPQLARNVVRALDISGDVGESVGRFVAAIRKWKQ